MNISQLLGSAPTPDSSSAPANTAGSGNGLFQQLVNTPAATAEGTDADYTAFMNDLARQISELTGAPADQIELPKDVLQSLKDLPEMNLEDLEALAEKLAGDLAQMAQVTGADAAQIDPMAATIAPGSIIGQVDPNGRVRQGNGQPLTQQAREALSANKADLASVTTPGASTPQSESVKVTSTVNDISQQLSQQATQGKPVSTELADKIKQMLQGAKAELAETDTRPDTKDAPKLASTSLVTQLQPTPVTVNPAAATPMTPAVDAPATTMAAKAAAVTTEAILKNNIIESDAWNKELGENMVRMARTGAQSVSLKLNPADLGQLNVDIKVQDKQVQMNFNNLQPQVRAAVEQALPQLRDMFADQGMNLSDSGFDDQRQFQQQEERKGFSVAQQSTSGEEVDGSVESDEDTQVTATKSDRVLDITA